MTNPQSWTERNKIEARQTDICELVVGASEVAKLEDLAVELADKLEDLSSGCYNQDIIPIVKDRLESAEASLAAFRTFMGEAQ